MKKSFITQFRGQKIMVNRVMNIESVTNSIEHVGVKKVTKRRVFQKGKERFRDREREIFI